MPYGARGAPHQGRPGTIGPVGAEVVDGIPFVAIADAPWRHRVRVSGRVHSMRVQPWEGIATLEIVLRDETGGMLVVFTGRRAVPGVALGVELEVEGRVGARRGFISMLNPSYSFVAR